MRRMLLLAGDYSVPDSGSPEPGPDVEAFENTERCWAFLGEASKAARCLGLVDAAAFEDRRNPDPVLTHPRTAEVASAINAAIRTVEPWKLGTVENTRLRNGG
jgi:hypothetical protein